MVDSAEASSLTVFSGYRFVRSSDCPVYDRVAIDVDVHTPGRMQEAAQMPRPPFTRLRPSRIAIFFEAFLTSALAVVSCRAGLSRGVWRAGFP
jgi:hypothetical protein